MNNSFVLAGASDKANSVSWDGSTENGFVATKSGNYKVYVVAKDENGKIFDEKYHSFQLDIAGYVLEASKDDSKNGTPAVLIMDEAIENPKNVWRYTGRPDYLLKADVSAQILKEENRSFTYQWDIANGTQYPYIYKKNRPSLGIHRQRNEFEVAIVTLLATKGHGFDFWCDENNKAYVYTATLSKEKFFNKDGISEAVTKALKMGNGQTVIGYDAGGSGHEYNIYLKVIVFPISAYKGLSDWFSDGQKVGEINYDLDWGKIWNKTYNASQVDNFIYNSYTYWGKVPLWEHEIKNFKKSSDDFVFSNKELPNTCVPKDSKNFVCGAVGDKKEEDYDVHKNMFKMEVYPTDRDKGYGSGRYSGKCNNRGSTTNLDVSVKLTVNSEYWEPALGNYKWGYNNLANRYVRFDPTNSSLYGSGYLSKVSKNHHYDGNVALNRNLEKIEEANKVYISNQGATLWQKKINLKNRNVAA